MALTPEEQWTEINYSRTFLIATLDKVNAVLDLLESNQIEAAPITTQLNKVPLIISNSDEGETFVRIDIGKLSDGRPQVSLTIPRKWVNPI